MKRRSSKNNQSKQTNHLLIQPRTISSPLKGLFMRDVTYSKLRKDRALVQLPKILPIHNNIRYPKHHQNYSLQEESTFNLIGINLYKKMIKQKKSAFDELIQVVEMKKQKTYLEKQQSVRHNFINKILASNKINRIFFSKKDKLKVFIDEGNNSRLINQLIRRRTNLKIVQNKSTANIVWTQFCDWQQANQVSLYTQNQLTRQNSTINSQINQSSNFTCKTQANQEENKYKNILINQFKMHNHLKNHYQISDKKCLFKNIRRYCKIQKIDQQDIIPKTFHLQNSVLPDQVIKSNSMWIIKPGQDTNRGTGITVKVGAEGILQSVKQLQKIGKTAIVQQYIDPLLYKNRKFDLRCYVLVTSYCGILKAYWYKQGYLRTCSRQFSYDVDNFYGHITNDAVQKKHKDYGKYEQCNKLSFNQLQNLFKSKDLNFTEALSRMKNLAYTSIKAAQDKLRGERNVFSFQIFGYDFLIDVKGKVWLIQINTNPCLQFSGSLLSRIIWHMVDNSFAIAIDPLLLRIPQGYNNQRDKIDRVYQQNKFQCII